MSGLGVVLASDAHARAHAALTLAAGAAAMGREVVLFATGPGVRLLAGVAPDAACEARLAGRGVATVAALLAASRAVGVRLIACEAGLAGEGMERVDEGVERAGVATFLEATRGGQLLAF